MVSVVNVVRNVSLGVMLSLAFQALCYAQADFDVNHTQWTKLLETHVEPRGHTTKVNYMAIKNDPEALNAYLERLSQVTEKEFKQWSDAEQIAFWINAYNAFTIKLIVDHYPVKSIKDVGGFFSSPWKKRFFTLLGKTRHLDEIEHQILRKNFNEPRIHFAINCASLSCPPLKAEAYTGEQLSEQLDEQTTLFLNTTEFNRVDLEHKRLYLSKIFKWFEKDFTDESKSLRDFLTKYFKIPDDQKTRIKEFQIVYLNYDWKLNDLK